MDFSPPQAVRTPPLLWDPADTVRSADPYPIYAQLRASDPIHRSPLGFWVFSRHADCLAMLRDRRVSSDTRRDRPAARHSGDTADPNETFHELIPFIFRDPPDHTRLRGLVQKAFTPRVIQQLEPRIRQICADLLDVAFERGEVDLVADYAFPLPIQIITEILGVPVDDRADFQTWSDAVARGLDPELLLPADALAQRQTGLLAFVEYFSDLISARRAKPREDLISRLIHAEASGDALNHVEIIATCVLLLIAGHETTVSLIAGGALALMEHPDQWVRFRDDPTAATTGIEEMLRYVSPVHLTSRIATRTMRFGDAVIEPGEACMLLIGSANRDPEVFGTPDIFDVGRSDNPHLGFGLGIHHCLGAPLARLESRLALRALVRQTQHWERPSRRLTYKDNIALRGLARLPVVLTPR